MTPLAFRQQREEEMAANRWSTAPRKDLAPGEAVLVAVSENLSSSLWLLSPSKGAKDAQVGDVARAAWQRAHDLQSEIPYLWRAEMQVGERTPRISRLAVVAAPGQQAPERNAIFEVDGASFGLTFALAQSSELLGLPLPGDLAASVALDPNSARLHRVERLEQKIKLLRECAPGVRRLLVAPGNADEARAIADRVHGDLEIVEVADFRQAAEVAFGPLDHLLDPAKGSETWRRDVLDSLCDLGWTTRGGVRAWLKVAGTARKILEDDGGWQLSEADRNSLAFTAAVAQRHAANQGTLTLPKWEELEGIPEPRRSQYMAHFLQQVADTACADAVVALEFAARLIPKREADRHPAHLELLGAQARLWAVMGRTSEALELARATTDAWMLRRLHDQVSRALCLWLRLAAAAGERTSITDALDTARLVRHYLLRDSPQCAGSLQFLDLAMAYALAALGEDRTDATAALEALLDKPQQLEPEVRLSAMRLSLRCMAANPTAAQTLREDLARDTSDLAQTFSCLADIDAGLGNPEESLERLAHHGGGLIKNLVDACRESEPQAKAAWIARWYPY